jgi:hypothetical protein
MSASKGKRERSEPSPEEDHISSEKKAEETEAPVSASKANKKQKVAEDVVFELSTSLL